MSRKLEGYSHPHTTPQWILMGNHRFEHHRSHISTSSLIVLEMVVVETYKPHVGVGVTQSLDVGITTT
jgi:hypothetical protein